MQSTSDPHAIVRIAICIRVTRPEMSALRLRTPLAIFRLRCRWQPPAYQRSTRRRSDKSPHQSEPVDSDYKPMPAVVKWALCISGIVVPAYLAQTHSQGTRYRETVKLSGRDRYAGLPKNSKTRGTSVTGVTEEDHGRDFQKEPLLKEQALPDCDPLTMKARELFGQVIAAVGLDKEDRILLVLPNRCE